MKKYICAVVVAAVVLGVGSVRAETDMPGFKNLRYEEDSAAYGEAAGVCPIKHMSLGSEGDAYFSAGAQARVRWETWDNFGFSPANDDAFTLVRLRLHGDLRLNDSVRAFVELKSASATRRDLPGGRRGLDVDDLDVQNAFVDIGTSRDVTDLTLRLGRQELSYGKQRLVSPLDWSNTRRTWDGVRAIIRNDHLRVDAFATQFVPVDKHDFNEPDSDTKFNGVYVTGQPPECTTSYDAYLLQLERENLAAGEDMILDEDRYTAGARVFGTCPLTRAKFDAEAGYQFGDRGDLDIAAWFAAIELAYAFDDAPMNPSLMAGYGYASGDDDPDDGDAGTFNHLFPLGHAYLGSVDIVGRQNIEDISLGCSFTPAEKLGVSLTYHIFSRAEREDALYNAGGTVVRAGDAGASRDVGTEVDLALKYAVNRNLTLSGGYSHFNAGDFIAESGDASDIDFGFVSAQYTF